jgi:hypothetical protein
VTLIIVRVVGSDRIVVKPGDGSSKEGRANLPLRGRNLSRNLRTSLFPFFPPSPHLLG